MLVMGSSSDRWVTVLLRHHLGNQCVLQFGCPWQSGGWLVLQPPPAQGLQEYYSGKFNSYKKNM